MVFSEVSAVLLLFFFFFLPRLWKSQNLNRTSDHSSELEVSLSEQIVLSKPLHSRTPRKTSHEGNTVGGKEKSWGVARALTLTRPGARAVMWARGSIFSITLPQTQAD